MNLCFSFNSSSGNLLLIVFDKRVALQWIGGKKRNATSTTEFVLGFPWSLFSNFSNKGNYPVAPKVSNCCCLLQKGYRLSYISSQKDTRMERTQARACFNSIVMTGKEKASLNRGEEKLILQGRSQIRWLSCAEPKVLTCSHWAKGLLQHCR